MRAFHELEHKGRMQGGREKQEEGIMNEEGICEEKRRVQERRETLSTDLNQARRQVDT